LPKPSRIKIAAPLAGIQMGYQQQIVTEGTQHDRIFIDIKVEDRGIGINPSTGIVLVIIESSGSSPRINVSNP
jgi:hypothetical protein